MFRVVLVVVHNGQHCARQHCWVLEVQALRTVFQHGTVKDFQLSL